jgi:hypothetical protein
MPGGSDPPAQKPPKDVVFELRYHDDDNGTYAPDAEEDKAIAVLWSRFASQAMPDQITIRRRRPGEVLD